MAAGPNIACRNESLKVTATVTATRDATLLFLSRELFLRLVSGVPALRQYFETLAEHRVIDTSLALSGSEDVDVLL